MQIIQIILPVFLIILAGFAMGKTKIIQPSHLDALNDFAYYAALPALIIISFWQVDFLQKGLASVIGYNFLALALFAFALLLGLNLFKIPPKTKAAIFLTSLVGNAIYLGFPLGQNAFGPQNFPLVAGAGAVHLVLGTFLGVMAAMHWTKKHDSFNLYLKEFFTNPLILALGIGVLLSFTPPFGAAQDMLGKTLSMLGSTASPVALFALGCFLSLHHSKSKLSFELAPTALKLVVFPAFVFVVLKKFGLSGPSLGVSALMAAMPSAVTTFVIAQKFKLDEKLVADSLLISTTLSVVTLSVGLLQLI